MQTSSRVVLLVGLLIVASIGWAAEPATCRSSLRAETGIPCETAAPSVRASTTWQTAPAAPFAATRFDAEFDPWSGYVFFLGGRLADASTDGSVLVYDPMTGGYADTGVDLPIPISNYTANLVEISNATGLFTIGGRQGNGSQTRAVQYYNPKINSAGALGVEDDYPGTLSPTSGFNAVVANRVYVAGGLDPATSPYTSEETWVFDYLQPAGSRWTRLVSAALVPARAYAMSAVVDGRIYAIGGATYDGASLYPVTDVQVLDPQAATPSWTSLAPLPEPCSSGRAWGFDSSFQGHAGMGRLAGKIVATCGGWPTENDRVYLYDTRSDLWTPFPSLLAARRDQAAALLPLPGGPVLAMWGGRAGDDVTLHSGPEYFELDPSPCTVLLVDDDLDAGGALAGGGLYYQRALLQLGWDYDIRVVALHGSPTAATLAPYPTVVWFTGDDRTTCVSAAEEAALVSYLDGGGSLILSSPDQIRARGLSPLLTQYLWVHSATQDVSVTSVAGIPLGASRSLGPYVLTRPSLWQSYWTGEPNVDRVVVAAGGHPPFSYFPGGYLAGTQGRADTGVPRRGVFLPWPLEWVNSTAERSEALGALLQWTDCPIFEDGFELGSTSRWSSSP